ncbi:hypothetical protein GCM10023340_24100 [Nocardioides marinquilinus]|uniref:Uncharacterized protein n=1 Tax=Nocardioides marinquilinus TaxID=1210400 RepID=A0ABP9PN60_9ACTN
MDPKALLGTIRRTAGGAASRVVPVGARVVGEARRRLGGARGAETRPSPESTPSCDETPAPAATPPAEADPGTTSLPEGEPTPSPASIAKNVAPPRPTVTPRPAEARPSPDDVPGGRLPPRR